MDRNKIIKQLNIIFEDHPADKMGYSKTASTKKSWNPFKNKRNKLKAGLAKDNDQLKVNSGMAKFNRTQGDRRPEMDYDIKAKMNKWRRNCKRAKLGMDPKCDV
jgi:hypothetical protein